MPYIKPERREVVDSFQGQYGDLVYYYYRLLVEHWNFLPSFSRYFQMRYLLPSMSHCSKVDGDIKNAFLDEYGKYRIPASLTGIEFAADYAYRCAVDELKRRYVDKYEDQKLKENGDVE